MTLAFSLSPFAKIAAGILLSLLIEISTFQEAIAETFEFNGLIEPHIVTQVGSPVPGVLATVNVKRGDLIKKGQILATLQSDVEKATMALAKERARLITTIKINETQLAFLERDKARITQLYEENVMTLKQKDEAETRHNIAALELQEAYENQRLAQLEYARAVAVVKRMTIRSPFDGVVVERLLSPGEYVENQPMLEIAQIDPLNIEVILPVDLFGKVKLGMNATIVPVVFSEAELVAKVTIIDRVVDAASGTFGVRLEMANPGYRLPSGLKCTVFLEAPQPYSNIG
jgi:RND family efflux transporter MFP subunit